MFLESELSEKLNLELESAGISVSEALIARTLAAVKNAQETEQDDVNKVMELADIRRTRLAKTNKVLLRVATVMAACFVLVVGGFALRFSTLRMGKESADMAPMAVADMAVRNGGTADDAATGTANESITYSADADMGAVEVPMECIESDAVDEETVMAEAETVTIPGVDALTDKLETVSYDWETSVTGDTVYRFIVEENGSQFCYLIHENGMVEYAEVTADGETGALMPYEGSDSAEFRREMMIWMKENDLYSNR